MTDAYPSEVVELSGFRLDRARRRLTGPDGVDIRLKPRELDTLAFLAAHPGEVVDKRVLLDAVWRGVVVEENNLNQAISALRRILGDSREAPRFIATVPGRGYQLVAPVRKVEAEPGADPVTLRRAAVPGAGATGPRRALWPAVVAAAAAILAVAAIALFPRSQAPADGAATVAAAPAAAAREASLVVLPFADRSEHGDQAWFASGLADELRDQLAQVDGLRVIGRVTSEALRERGGDVCAAAKALDIAYVLDGSVRRSGDRLRISAELVDTADCRRAWSPPPYDRPADDVLAVQEDIAREVVEAVPAGLSAGGMRERWERQATDPATHDLYIHALALLRAGGQGGAALDNLRRAETLFREAIARDPAYFPAQQGLAEALWDLSFASPAPEKRTELDEVIARLIEHAPTAADAHFIRAEQLLLRYDWLGMRRELEAAAAAPEFAPLRTEGAPALALIRYLTGSPGAALDDLRAAVRADPLSFGASNTLMLALTAAGRIDEAEAEYVRSRDIATSDRSPQEWNALMRALRQGFGRPAVAERSRRLRAAVPRPTELDPVALLDDRPAALAALRRELSRSDPDAAPPFAIAAWADYFGDTDLALETLSRSFELGTAVAAWELWVNYPNTRRTPGFKDLLRKYGYEKYWRATGEWGDFCRAAGEDELECR